MQQIHQIIMNVKLHTNKNTVTNKALQGASFIVVSNQLFHLKYKVEALAQVLACDQDQNRIIIGNNIILELKSYQYSYYSKLGRLIGGLLHIRSICQKYNITNCKIEARYDRDKAIKVAKRFKYEPTIVIGYFYLVTSLHHRID